MSRKYLYLFIMLPGLASSDSADWTVTSGRLTFVATQQEAEFEGEFETFSTDIRFDPDDLSSSRIHATIDLTSTNTQNSERDVYLFGPDFFFVEKYAQAEYRAERIRSTGDNVYVADGTLSLRGFDKSVPLEFTFSRETDRAKFVGEGQVLRLDFGVGQGMWTDTAWVGNEVRVNVELDLVQQ